MKERNVMEDERWEELGIGVEEMEENEEEKGIKIVYNKKMGKIVEKEEEIESMMSLKGKKKRILIDKGNWMLGRGNKERVEKKNIERVGNINEKNIRRDIVKEVREKKM